MLTLALDTALDRAAVALSGGPAERWSRVERMERGQAERLLPLVEDLLMDAGVALAEVGRIGVDIGPGSFTGIRIAVAAARGLGLALDVPVVGVDSLAVLAASLEEPADGPVLAVIDARRGELYAALYDVDGSLLLPPFAADAGRVLATVAGRASVMIGSGAPILAHHAVTTGARLTRIDPATGPDPIGLARLAAGLDPAAAPPKPLYIRPADAKPQPPIPGLLR
jgi:tRNA threonylcarbamoyladenosine biosynthesis protein TsaB